MGVFRDAEHLYECIGGLFDVLRRDPKIGGTLANAKLLIRFKYRDPDAVITINCVDKPAEPDCFVAWMRGDGGLTPTVEMEMSADVAHRFWLGRVNLLFALTKGEIKARGPIPKLLALLPAIRPAYALYPVFLREKGYGALAE
ncbi:MAG: hypothetical protein HYZ53_23540 [Planctomycetes bacterium]|nr:hypothetical protein [Planctomycetota bacterium]